jgi:hypothetical protein
MKRITYLVLLLAVLFTVSVQAQVPRHISFQGVLTDASGQAVADGTYQLTLRLYDNEMAAPALWTETQNAAVNAGLFNVRLGKETPLPLSFDKPLWLGVSVNGAEELRPRSPLASSPYALHADVASALAPGAGGVVRSVNGADGDVTLQGAGGTTVTRSGNTVTISSTGGQGGNGIQGVQNTDGSISVLNPAGPIATIGVADNAVVKSLSVGATTLRDDVVLQAGNNIMLTPIGNTVTISASGSGGAGIQSIQSTNQTLDIINPDGPQTTIDIAAGAVGPTQLADNAVTASKLADGVVTPSKVNPAGALPGQVLSFDGSAVQWTTPSGGAGVGGSGAVGRLAIWNDNTDLGSVPNLVFSNNRFGVGISSPSAGMHIVNLNGLLSTATTVGGDVLNLGFGVRMHWYQKNGAFRAGRVTGDHWDDANMGTHSFATGYNSKATNLATSALGYETEATGEYSFASGFRSKATAVSATAIGSNTVASGGAAVAMGSNAEASGAVAISLGKYSKASGETSVAFGENTEASASRAFVAGHNSTASGVNSFAIGVSATASGSNSFAFGNNVSTNSHTGAFVLGCQSPAALMNATAPNQMSMRFAGGYRLFSDLQQSKGVYMNAGVSGWTNYSDRNKKEHFSEIDGEVLLTKIRRLPVTEWSYIGGDPAIRYIGPMAQDFWQAFRLGGSDSLGINSISIDGVNLAAVKALEVRTAELMEKTARIAELEARVAELETQRLELATLRQEMEAIRALLQREKATSTEVLQAAVK